MEEGTWVYVSNRECVLTLVAGVPLVDGEVMVARDGGDGGRGDGRVRVGGHVAHRRVGQELHDHAHVVLHAREHHRRLAHRNNGQSGWYI